MSCSKDPVKMIAYILVLVGALNWGLVGAFQFDLVQFLLGSIPVAAQIVYILVGISAVYLGVKMCCCSKGSCSTQ